jgi:hypothetical protein
MQITTILFSNLPGFFFFFLLILPWLRIESEPLPFPYYLPLWAKECMKGQEGQPGVTSVGQENRAA